MKRINKFWLISLALLLSLWTIPSLKAQKNDRLPSKTFAPFLRNLRMSKEQRKVLTIVHLGDSHVKSGDFSEAMQEELRRRFGSYIRIIPLAVNGATYASFSSKDYISKIVSYRPDLLIVSLGTNDAYTFDFSASEFRLNVEAFFSLLAEDLPKFPVLLTTPPASYLKKRVKIRRRRYHTTYSFNPNTIQAVNTLIYMAHFKSFGLLDLYARFGAISNTEQWLQKGKMSYDHIHYRADVYRLFGQTVAQFLITSANQTSL